MLPFAPCKTNKRMSGYVDDDGRKKGVQEVLELLLLGGEGRGEEDDDDDIFVRMISWGGVILLLGLVCVKWLDAAVVVESCTMSVLP